MGGGLLELAKREREREGRGKLEGCLCRDLTLGLVKRAGVHVDTTLCM